MPFPQALTIAGSDSGGGAGIQADIKTMQMRGVFATSVLTAITAQNTRGVSHIEMASVASVRAQLAAIAADFDIAAHKIGMLGTAEMIACVADCLRSCRFGALVLDPVMVAKGGAPLLQHDAIAALKTHLLPRADLVTPNLPEAELLSGHAIRSEADVAHAAASLLALGAKGVVIKGGHWQESGSAICITAELAKGAAMADAIRSSKAYISAAIASPLNIGHGHGPVNHWAGGGDDV